ncbi:MAG: hypothetical protein MK171_06405 [Pirellulales bacterium]|nr:hypothetical protein [Pirellulales bacterium]
MSDPKPPPISHPVGVLHDIRWNEIFPWLILVRGLRVSLLVRVILLAWVGVLLTQLGWTGAHTIFSDSGPLSQVGAASAAPLEQLTERRLPLELLNSDEVAWNLDTPLAQAWQWLGQPFFQLAGRHTSWLNRLPLALSAVWSIAVWALLGSAISRIAAMHLTRGETLSIQGALKASVAVFGSAAGAPLIALLASTALALPLALAGALLRFDSVALAVGLGWAVAIVWGLVLAVMVVGVAIGWPLMWATLAVERSDAFDAVSRSYAYVYQRPLHLAFFLLVAALLGVMGDIVVTCFATAAVHLSEWTIQWGGGLRSSAIVGTTSNAIVVDGHAAISPTGAAATGATAIGYWKWAWMALAASYPVAFFWSTAVAIYLLMRRYVDSTEMDEAQLIQEEPVKGLPELQNSETGVPEVKRP